MLNKTNVWDEKSREECDLTKTAPNCAGKAAHATDVILLTDFCCCCNPCIREY